MWELAGWGLGLASGFMGGKDKGGGYDIFAPREHQEAVEARQRWFDNLMKWGADPDYGAIAPDWDNVWAAAKRQISDYFQGTPGSPGLRDKIQSEHARRRTSDTPSAIARSMLQADAEEGRQISDVASQQALARTQFGESARMNWLNSMQNLASLQAPQPTIVPQAPEQGSGAGQAMGMLGGALTGYGAQRQQQNWMRDFFSKMGGMPGGQNTATVGGQTVPVAPPDYFRRGM